MSESDDSNDEQLNMLLESVDTSLLNNQLFAKTSAADDEKAPVPKSQRFPDTTGTSQENDLQVPEAMQQFIGKKLSRIIEKRFAFVDPSELPHPKARKITKSPKNRLKLLEVCDVPVKYFDGHEDDSYIRKKRKPELKRREIEPDNLSESERIQAVAVDYDFIQSGMEVNSWTGRPRKNKVFVYRGRKGCPLQYIEPDNEFTKMRKKNCWSEKKISQRLSGKKDKR